MAPNKKNNNTPFTREFDKKLMKLAQDPKYREGRSGKQSWKLIKAKLGVPHMSSQSISQRYLRTLNPKLKKGKFLPEERRKIIDALNNSDMCWVQISREVFNSTRSDVQLRAFAKGLVRKGIVKRDRIYVKSWSRSLGSPHSKEEEYDGEEEPDSNEIDEIDENDETFSDEEDEKILHHGAESPTVCSYSLRNRVKNVQKSSGQFQTESKSEGEIDCLRDGNKEDYSEIKESYNKSKEIECVFGEDETLVYEKEINGLYGHFEEENRRYPSTEPIIEDNIPGISFLSPSTSTGVNKSEASADQFGDQLLHFMSIHDEPSSVTAFSRRNTIPLFMNN